MEDGIREVLYELDQYGGVIPAIEDLGLSGVQLKLELLSAQTNSTDGRTGP